MKICSKKDIKAITGIMAASLVFTGCSANVKNVKNNPFADDPKVKTEINLNKVTETKYDDKTMNEEYRRYCFDLLNKTLEDSGANGENVMISPTSIMIALDMVAAGAKGESLKQLTDLFAKGQGPLEQQAFAAAMMDKINNSKDVDFTCANAVWNNETRLGNAVNTRYVDYIKATFLAEYKVQPFDDKTPAEINEWIDKNTKHMIKKAVDEIDPDTVMILVNAIAFDGKWKQPYSEYQIEDDMFKKPDGTEQKATFLNDTLKTYFETDKATGFMKVYEGDEYAFVAILPKDVNISANEFAKNFTAEDYETFINSRTTKYEVYSKMPEFKSDFSCNLIPTLNKLGVTDIFKTQIADLSGMAKEPGEICVSKVNHVTHIEVDRSGTKAAAVTVVMQTDACLEEMPRYKTVNCDRPFVYAIVDTKTMAPIFIGTVNGI